MTVEDEKPPLLPERLRHLLADPRIADLLKDSPKHYGELAEATKSPQSTAKYWATNSAGVTALMGSFL